MSVRVIPKQEMIICDRCGAEDSGAYGSNEFYSGHLHMNCRDRLTGPLGESAGGEKSYDLCYRCMTEFYKWMKHPS